MAFACSFPPDHHASLHAAATGCHADCGELSGGYNITKSRVYFRLSVGQPQPVEAQGVLAFSPLARKGTAYTILCGRERLYRLPAARSARGDTGWLRHRSWAQGKLPNAS